MTPRVAPTQPAALRRVASLLATASLLCSVAAHAAPLPGWSHVRAITVDNTRQPSPLTAWPLHVVLDSSNFRFADARPDGSDIRFTNAAGTLLPYWIESWDPARSAASLWVKSDSIPGSGTATLLLDYGNAGASSAADPAGTFLFYNGFEQRNTAAALVTPTPDGSGQGMHPGVVHIPAGWHGYAYWMSVTPYPFDNDALENPSILASNDGLTWVVPAGLTNPIAPGFAGGFNNDNDLLFQGDKLICYYNETWNSGTTNIRRLESADGVHWTAPVTVLTFPNSEMSPTIIVDGGVYKMWYVTSNWGCWSATQDVHLCTSTDGIHWSDPQDVSFDDPAIIPWHPDVKKDGGTYRMLSAAHVPGSTCEHTDLYYAESTDGLNWTWTPQPLIARSAGGWDNFEIYRSSFLVENGRLRIWYSASSTAHVWGTAYVEGTLQELEAARSGPWGWSQGDLSMAGSPVHGGQRSLKMVGGSTYPQIATDLAGKYACTAWFYDDMDVASEHAALLRIWDSEYRPGDGVGLYTGESATNYVDHRVEWQYETSPVARTAGWHQLSIRVAADSCRLAIDGTTVASLADLNADDIQGFSFEGDAGGTHWVDDVYARPYVEPEPGVRVGPADATTGVDGPAPGLVTRVSLGPARPNPAAGGTAITLALPQEQPVSVRVVGIGGALVRSLHEGPLAAGTHVLAWDGGDGRGHRAPSGVYFVVARVGGELRSRRIVLLR